MAIPDPATTEWVPIWNPVGQGPKGDTGATGPAGPTGPAGNAVPHHVTHETGGIDAITTLSGGVITTGTVADARLSTNIPKLNASNLFTANIQGINAQDCGWALIDPTRPVDARRFHIINSAGFAYIQAVNDALTISQSYVRVARDGSITERARTLPLGEWTDIPFAASNFVSAGGGMTWTVVSGSQTTFAYTLIGKTALIAVTLGGTTVSGTPSQPLRIVLPIVPTHSNEALFWGLDNGTQVTIRVRIINGDPSLYLYRSDGANWSISPANTTISGQAFISI
jgi:hypothetical protein